MIDSVTKAQKLKNPGNAGNKSITAGMAGVSLSKPDSGNYLPPPKNDRLLGSLPNKKLSPEELKSFIAAIDKKLTALLNSEGVRLPPVEQLDAGTVCQSAIMDLLQGGGEEAAWLAIKAIEKAPGNILVLNNCGAILNGCGFQPVAIPVLETALQKSPE
ncbi:MAG TPA: hypothetical protein VNV85_14525, partial [Puia sp.]|nr:hypothetical protein [Puia sp.]